MAECEFLSACPFFNDRMAHMPGTAAIVKRDFCREHPATCARYMVRMALGPGKVPADLFPYQKDIAEGLLKRPSLAKQ